jgi:hypothetical protein
MAADFTSNLLSLPSTAESNKCHYGFVLIIIFLIVMVIISQSILTPFLQLSFRTKEGVAEAQNRGFSCGLSKAVGDQLPSGRCHVDQEEDCQTPPRFISQEFSKQPTHPVNFLFSS